jgi:hypothetical protein
MRICDKHHDDQCGVVWERNFVLDSHWLHPENCMDTIVDYLYLLELGLLCGLNENIEIASSSRL